MAFPSTDLDVIVEAFLGADLTSTDPLNDWTPTDLSSRLIRRPIIIARGRGPGQPSFQAARCSLWLDNTDGALTPLLPTSAYYPDWDLNVPLRVAVDNVGASPEYTRFRGHVDSIQPAYIPGSGGPIAAVRVTASGVSRRLSQGGVSKSALRRTIGAAEPIEYWPLEDPSEATLLASGIAGGTAIALGSNPPESGASGLADGASGALDVGGTGVTLKMSLALTAMTTWSISWVGRCYIDSSPTAAWLFRLNGPVQVIAYVIGQRVAAQVGSTVVYTDVVAGNATGDADPHHFRLTLTQNGTGVDVQLSSDGTVATGGFPGSATLSSTTNGSPTSVELGNLDGRSQTATLLIGHLAIFSGAWATNLNATSGAVNAYAGESAHVRIARVLAEEGVIADITGSESVELGPQPVATVLEVCTEAEKVDRGVLAESLSTWGISYICGGERQNLDATLTIDLSTYRTTAGTMAEVLAPIYDDQRIRNEWTIDSDFGSATESDTLHIARRGRYDDQDTANVASQQGARDLAGWLVHEGTVEELRYPAIPLDLSANHSAILPTWLEVDIGARVDRTNQPAMFGGTAIRGSLEGYEETIDAKSWSAKLNAPPYAPWQVGVLADTSGDTDPDLGRMAADPDAAIRVAIDSDDLSMDVDPNFYRFTTAADDLDPDLKIRLGGEVVEVSGIATTAGTFVAAGAASHADNAAVTPALYAGASARDLILVFAAIRSSGTGTLQTPTGYTRLPVFGATDNVQLFAKVHSGSESNPTVTPSGGSAGDSVSAVTFGLRGTPCTLEDLTDIVVDSLAQLNSSAQNIAYPGIYPRWVEGCIVLALGWKQDDWTSVATLSGFTGEAVDASTTTGNDQGLVVDYLIQTTPAVVAESSFTVTGGASAISRGALVAIAAGYQTFTISNRSVNAVTKSHAAGTKIEVEDALVLTL